MIVLEDAKIFMPMNYKSTQILIYFPFIILCIHDLYTNYYTLFQNFLDKFNDILVNINNNRNNQRKCMTFTYF